MTAINSAHKKGMIHPAEYAGHVERVLAAAERPSIAARVLGIINRTRGRSGVLAGIPTGKKRK